MWESSQKISIKTQNTTGAPCNKGVCGGPGGGMTGYTDHRQTGLTQDT